MATSAMSLFGMGIRPRHGGIHVQMPNAASTTSTAVSIDSERAIRALEDFRQDTESVLTEYAYRFARNFLEEIGVRALFSNPSISLDGDGGILMDWEREGRRVRLVIRDNPDLQSYIYYQSGNDYSAEYDLTGAVLIKRLNWLIAG